MTTPRTEDEWDVFRRQLEAQLEEYEHAVREAGEWWSEWKRRNKGFRCKRNVAHPDH